MIFWVAGKNCIIKNKKCIIFSESQYLNMNPGILWKYTSGIFEVYLKCNSFKKIKFTTNINKKVNRKKVLNNFLKSENEEL